MGRFLRAPTGNETREGRVRRETTPTADAETTRPRAKAREPANPAEERRRREPSMATDEGRCERSAADCGWSNGKIFAACASPPLVDVKDPLSPKSGAIFTTRAKENATEPPAPLISLVPVASPLS